MTTVCEVGWEDMDASLGEVTTYLLQRLAMLSSLEIKPQCRFWALTLTSLLRCLNTSDGVDRVAGGVMEFSIDLKSLWSYVPYTCNQEVRVQLADTCPMYGDFRKPKRDSRAP